MSAQYAIRKSCGRCGRDGVQVKSRRDTPLCEDCRDVEPPQVARALRGQTRSLTFGTAPDHATRRRRRAAPG